MLVRVHDDDVLKAALLPPPSLHPRALPTLLEALSLWHQAPVRVVLCAAEAAMFDNGSPHAAEIVAELAMSHAHSAPG